MVLLHDETFTAATSASRQRSRARFSFALVEAFSSPKARSGWKGVDLGICSFREFLSFNLFEKSILVTTTKLGLLIHEPGSRHSSDAMPPCGVEASEE